MRGKMLLVLMAIGILSGNMLAESQDDRIAALEKKVQEMEKSKGMQTNFNDFNIKLYGFLRLDGVWTDSSVDSGGGNVIFIKSKPESTNENDNQLSASARATRLGLDITGPASETLKSSGKIEFDFFGSGNETNNAPRMRHAYLKLDMPESNMSILAGQTWDVIAPVLPPTIDQSVLWWQGNIGIRRTQLRLTQNIPLSDRQTLKIESALARTVGSTNANDLDSGTDSGKPSVQGRISLTTPVFNDLDSTFGISGHYANEEFDTTEDRAENINFDSWSMAFDMSLPITKATKVTGEIYTGANCGAYTGGIGQTVNYDETTLSNSEEVESTGGWVALSHKINDQFSLAGGFGMDSVDSETIADESAKLNQTAFGNVVYSPITNVKSGLEVAHNTTEYKNSDDGNSLRVSMFMQLNF